jgi:hypothetical protein
MIDDEDRSHEECGEHEGAEVFDAGGVAYRMARHGRGRRVVLCGVMAFILALAAATPVRAIFATEGTLQLFLAKQIAEMIAQFDLQSAGWGFHRDEVNAAIGVGLTVIHDELAERRRYKDLGFDWETPDPVYGRVERILGLLEGDVPQSEAEAVTRESAYIQVVDMKTGAPERRLVLERYPGAALRYARYAALMKATALGGDVYEELESHRRTVEILRRIANVPRMSPGRSEQIMKIIDFYESLLATNTAELDAVRSNAEGIDKLYESYRDNFREAARYQADSVARRQTYALEVSGKRVYEHSWEQ